MRSFIVLIAALSGLLTPALAQTIAPADIAPIESSGTMRDIAAGAYEKTLWRDNKRSELVEAIKALPPESPLRAIHDMKRRALLSDSDVTLIDNDIDITPDNNLFILRLQKLQEMGLYEDALKLYTDHVDTPRDARLAETGLVLIAHQRGLATACLEEKVLAAQFEDDDFFTLIDSICAFELGQTDISPAVPQSTILEAAFADETMMVPAMNNTAFTHMTPLELAVLKSEGHIDYTTFDTTPGALKHYPARVLMTFLEDKNLPEERFLPLQIEMARRGYVSVKKLPAAKDAKQLGVDVNAEREANPTKADDLFWQSFIPLLDNDAEIVNLTPYGGLLKDADPARLTGDKLTKAVAVLLASGYDMPANWCQRLDNESGPRAHVYSRALVFLGACEQSGDKAVDSLETALEGFSPENHGNLWVLMGLFAPEGSEYANFLEVYEKHFPLTLHDDYVMHKDALERGSLENEAFQGFGLSLLQTLNAGSGETGEYIKPATLQITVKGLLDDGLDNDARQLAKEVLVGILLNNKKLGENNNG